MYRLCVAIALVTMVIGCAEMTELNARKVDGPIVGAIRWDAWTGGGVTTVVEKTLGPKQFHFRLPWFAEVIGENEVKIDGSPEGVMDREIDWAADAGLDYWVFGLPPQTGGIRSMGVALSQYLASPKRGRINFCLILGGVLKVNEDHWPAERDRIIRLLREPGYQTVLGGRPLIYVFWGGEYPWKRFAEFQEAIRAEGLNPYYTFMGWWPGADYRNVSPKGFDAVSNYAAAHDKPRFADLVGHVEHRYWKRAVDGDTRYIPLVTSGWDKRPRQANLVPWEEGAEYRTQKVFPAQPTPAELAAHLRNAITFVNEHPEVCEARAIIIYAWNEYDEGGWIAPTRGADGNPNTERLDAIRTVLEPQSPSKPRSHDSE